MSRQPIMEPDPVKRYFPCVDASRITVLIIDSQPLIKDEDDEDTFGGNEEHDFVDSGIYKPRPQLPKPFVFMRSLADIISK
jgi:hypothetical protein